MSDAKNLVDDCSKISLREIEYYPGLSERANAFAASVYVDGVRLCSVQNSGDGTPTEFVTASRVGDARIRKLDGLFEHGSLKSRVEAMVADDLLAEELREAMALGSVVFRFEDEYLWVHVGDRADVVARLKRDDADYRVLNNAPFDEAFELWKENRR